MSRRYCLGERPASHCSSLLFTRTIGAAGMGQQLKAPIAGSNNLSWIPWTHEVGELVFTSSYTHILNVIKLIFTNKGILEKAQLQ